MNLRVIAVAFAFMLGAAAAQAQPAAWTDRGYFTAGVEIRLAGGSFTDVVHPIDFAEVADVSTTYRMKAAPGVEVGGGVRVWRNLGIGVGVSYAAKAAAASVDAQMPHPLVFGKPRPVSGVEDLARDETAVNVQLVWVMPIDRRWQVAIAGGPSWISVNQDLVQNVAITQSYPFDTATYGSAVRQRSSKSGVGFNAGIDATYLFARRVGLDASATFARAHIPFGASAGSDAGGLHVAGGLRVRF